ncbi:MAG: lyase [Acidimicrobiia bacterium]
MRSLLVSLLVLAACTVDGGEPPSTGPNSATSPTTAAPTTTSPESESATSLPGETTTSRTEEALVIEAFPVPAGSRPHDVAPAADGGVWYTAQGSGELGWLDPATGETRHVALGAGSRPHGVIVDDEGTPWITDGGLNAIVSVDPVSEEVTIHPLPDTSSGANLNTAVFDENGTLWFTGQDGVIGRLDSTGEIEVHPAPGGAGPYGITATPDGSVFFASLAGSYVGEVEDDGTVRVLEPPTPGQGARRVWSDSSGSVWVSEWNSGGVSRYDPSTGVWASWELPGQAATYAVYVDDADVVWLSDFGGNAIVRFDPVTETFTRVALPHEPGEVRQLHGRPGEVWGAESAADHLVLIRTG